MDYIYYNFLINFKAVGMSNKMSEGKEALQVLK